MTNRKSDAYNGNANVKRDGVEEQFTQAQVDEYIKCSESVHYFVEKYCMIINLDDGLVPFNLYEYQSEMFDTFNNNRFNIMLACRQSGKSISSCAYLLWYAIFHSEKTVAILANKHSTSKEMLGRITLMLENIPFWLQPGCKALNRSSIEFSNNSVIIAAPTSSSSIRGLAINLLYLDEFAFVEDAATFYTSTYPVITSGKSTKVIITSTANGVGNPFHTIWQGAVQEVNAFAPIRVDWWDVPGRDEEWKKETIANTSERQFEQEFGNTFFGTGDTLIEAEHLMKLKAHDPAEYRENGNLHIYKRPKEDHQYILCADVGKGRGQDYSSFHVVDITTRPFEQVAVYHYNKISPLVFPDIIYKWANLYNEAYLVVESNDQGSLVCHQLWNDLEYENMYVTSTVKADSLGLDINRRSKRIGCSMLKDLIETDTLKIYHGETISELSTFEAKGQTFQASQGNNDDLVMALVCLGYFTDTDQFFEMSDTDIKMAMYEERIRQIEADIPPFGIVDDGLDEELMEEFMSISSFSYLRDKQQREHWQVVETVRNEDIWDEPFSVYQDNEYLDDITF